LQISQRFLNILVPVESIKYYRTEGVSITSEHPSQMIVLLITWREINPQRTESAFEIPSSRKTVTEYNLEEYFGIDVQMKVIDLEFLILSIRLYSSLLS
jgi:hypothetical protein